MKFINGVIGIVLVLSLFSCKSRQETGTTKKRIAPILLLEKGEVLPENIPNIKSRYPEVFINMILAKTIINGLKKPIPKMLRYFLNKLK